MPKIKEIRKRNGKIVPFKKDKITKAILKAGGATKEFGYNIAEALTNIVVSQLEEKAENGIPEVEMIQNIIEKVIFSAGFEKTSRAYIVYREQHKEMRQFKNLFKLEGLVDDYLSEDDWRVKENSNMGYSLQGLNNYISAAVTSRYWLNKIYPKEIRMAHKKGELHIHDLGILAPYCCGWDLKDLLLSGIQGAGGKSESKPAKHLRTALGQIVNFFYSLQGESAGAQAFSSFDTYLAPFIRYDNLDYEQVKQALQEFIFNMNVPTRVGFQTPFTNITLDLNPSGLMAEENVIVGGQIQKEKYKDFQPEMDIFNRAFAEVMLEGDAKGRVFTFPIPTYNLTKDFNWENPVLKPIFEMTAKYGIPYFSNFINSDMSPDDARSMCCRLRLDNRELRKRGGGLFGANPLTGSIGVVTINLPRIGHEAKNKKEFLEKLSQLIEIAKSSLEIKRKFLEKSTDRDLYPYSRFYLRDVKSRNDNYWKNHFNTIGIIGMNEALLNLLGKNIASPEGRTFALEVMDFVRDKLRKYQEETGELYNLEATPAEGVTYRFAKKDKELFPEIIVANEANVKEAEAHPYYTNSTHLPVNYTADMFEALALQDDLQSRYTGGTVFHGFLGEKMPDPESVKQLVRKIAEKFTLPYFTITPTFSVCPKHGYLAGEHEFCPKCDLELELKKKQEKSKS